MRVGFGQRQADRYLIKNLHRAPSAHCGKSSAKKRAPDTVKNPPSFQEEAHCWTQRYEKLREQVRAGESLIGTERWGLTLLIRQGVDAWMRARHDPLCCPAAAALEADALPMSLRESWQQEATRLLVNMALSQLSPSACNT